jgi:hypothetical protein
MRNDVAVAQDVVELVFTREEAELVVDALRTLLNARRFGFKEPHEDMRHLHAQLFDLLERVDGQVKRAFGK